MGFRARLNLRSLVPVWHNFVDDDDGHRGWGLSSPDICTTVEEELRKIPQPGKLTRAGIEPGPASCEATMIPLDHSGGQE